MSTRIVHNIRREGLFLVARGSLPDNDTLGGATAVPLIKPAQAKKKKRKNALSIILDYRKRETLIRPLFRVVSRLMVFLFLNPHPSATDIHSPCPAISGVGRVHELPQSERGVPGHSAM